MLEPKLCPRIGDGDARNRQTLLTRAFAGNDADSTSRHGQRLRHDLDELRVRGAVHGRAVQPDDAQWRRPSCWTSTSATSTIPLYFHGEPGSRGGGRRESHDDC
jgi:hypothetical protein